MNSFSYTKRDSFLDSIDALNKFFWLFGIAFLSYCITNPLHQFILFLSIVFIILFLGKIPIKNFLSGMIVFVTFGFIMFLMQLLFYTGGQGEIIFEIGKLSVTYGGFIYGLNLALRVFVVGSSALSFVMTTEPRRMIFDMISRAKLPYRFAYTFYSALRFIPIFEEEARNIMNAHIVRGTLEKEKGLAGKLKIVKRLAVPLVVTGVRKARMSAVAMDARAFGAYSKRTLTYRYDVPKMGYVFSIIVWVIGFTYLYWLLKNGLWINS